MAWKPAFAGHLVVEPFASYRGRVGRLYRGEAEVGLLLVRVDQLALHLSGHLWWKRWGQPEDFFWLFTVVDGQLSDTWLVPTDMTENEVRDWSEGRYEHGDEVLRLVWVPQEEAARLARSEFGYPER